MARRFPIRGGRRRLQWSVYNQFMKKGAATDRKDAVAPPTEAPDVVPVPPILPLKREWREAVLEGTGGARPGSRDATRVVPPSVTRDLVGTAEGRRD
jgi:hypothetical protein